MQLKNVENVIPQQTNVVVNVKKVAKDKEGIYLGETASTPTDIGMYFGSVISLGPNAGDEGHCPGLSKGDKAFFSEFSGYGIATNDNNFNKLIPAYDIMAIVTDENDLTINTISPTADRLLVEVCSNDKNEDGLVLTGDSAKDPRLADINYAKFLKAGPSSTQTFTEGQLVAYDPYSGEKIKPATSSDSPELRLIREADILFVVE